MRWSRLAVCSLLCAALVVPVWAEKEYAEQQGPGGRFKKMYSRLNLTGEQRQAMEKNKAEHREKMKADFEKVKALKEELNAELMKPKLDMGKIGSLQKQFKALQGKLADDRLGSVLAVRKILTPEQFAKFVKTMKEHGPRGHWRKDGGKHREHQESDEE